MTRDEDFVVFDRIVGEEIANARTSFEENIRREDGMFSTMSDEEAEELAKDIGGELAAISPWSGATDEA